MDKWSQHNVPYSMSKEKLMSINEIVAGCKKILQDHYREQFQGLILYGSIARQEAELESDIDLLILLKKPFDYFQELRSITSLLYPMQLESERLISVKPAALDDFNNGEIQLYRNVKREGLAV